MYVVSNEISEWYRINYNIPLHVFQDLNIPEEIMYEDFYRRQYYEEIRLNLRTLDDLNNNFKMPPFPMFRPYGGSMPVPNGYGVTTSYSYDSNKSSDDASSNNFDQVIENEDGSYTFSSSRRSDASGSVIDTQRSEYKSKPEEFEYMMKNMEDDNLWEEWERMAPGED